MNFTSFNNFISEVRDSSNEYFQIDNNGNVLDIWNFSEYLRIELIIDGKFMVYDITFASKTDQEDEFFEYAIYSADGVEIPVQQPFIENEILKFINNTEQSLIDFAIE